MKKVFKKIDNFLKEIKETNSTEQVKVIEEQPINKEMNLSEQEQKESEQEQKESEQEQKVSEESTQNGDYVSIQKLKEIKPTEIKEGFKYSQKIIDEFKERNENNLRISNESIEADVKTILLKTFQETKTEEYNFKVSLRPITVYSMFEENINNFFYFARKYKSNIPLYKTDSDDDFTDDGNFLFFIQNKLMLKRSPKIAYGVYTLKNETPEPKNKVICNLLIEQDKEGNINCDNPGEPDSQPCETKACNITIDKIDLSRKDDNDGLKIFSLPDEVFKKPIKVGVKQVYRYMGSIQITDDYRMLLNARKTILIDEKKNEAFKIYKVVYDIPNLMLEDSLSSAKDGSSVKKHLYVALNNVINQAKRGGNKEIASYHIRRPAYTTKHKLCRKPIKNRTMRKKRTNKRKQ